MGGWIAVDLDGTLSEHYWPAKGDYDHTRIGDPIPAMLDRVRSWAHRGEDVRIFTARVSPTIPVCSCHERYGHWIEAAEIIAQWTLEHIGVALQSTATKDYQMKVLWDDRCVQVIMNTGNPVLCAVYTCRECGQNTENSAYSVAARNALCQRCQTLSDHRQ